MIIKLIQNLLSFGNRKNFLFKEINKLRIETENLHGTLDPIDVGELQFLSYQHVPQKKFSRVKLNILTSIYNEPNVAYYIKNYDNGDSKIMVAYTSDKVYSYILHDKKTDVFVNDKPFARVYSSGEIKDLSNKVVGKITYNPSTMMKELYLHEQHVANIKKADKMTSTERVFQGLYTKTKNDEDLVISVTLPYFIFPLQK